MARARVCDECINDFKDFIKNNKEEQFRYYIFNSSIESEDNMKLVISKRFGVFYVKPEIRKKNMVQKTVIYGILNIIALIKNLQNLQSQASTVAATTLG